MARVNIGVLGTKLQMCTHKVVENLNGWSCKVRLPTSLHLNWYLPGNTHGCSLPLLCVTVNKTKKLKKAARLMNKVV